MGGRRSKFATTKRPMGTRYADEMRRVPGWTLRWTGTAQDRCTLSSLSQRRCVLWNSGQREPSQSTRTKGGIGKRLKVLVGNTRSTETGHDFGA